MFVQDSVSRITSSQYACVLCCFKTADGEFLEDFLFNFFKRRRLAYRKLEQFLNVSIRWLSLLSGCSHYQYYYKLHYIYNFINISLFFQAKLLDFLGDLIFWQ